MVATTIVSFPADWVPPLTAISPDGKRAAYARYNQTSRTGVLILDGQASSPFLDLNEMVFSGDSRRFAYSAKFKEGWRALIDGERTACYETIVFLRFSPDGSHWSFLAKRPDGLVVVVDKKIFGPFDSYISDGVIFPGQSQRYAFAMGRAGKMILVTEAGEKEPLAEMSVPVFSSNGQHLAHLARQGTARPTVWLDGRSQGMVFDEIALPEFSPDGQHLAYGAKKNGGWRVVLGKKEGRAYPKLLSHAGMVFSPDSRHLAYAAERNGKQVIVTDGIEKAKAYEGVGKPTFSPDSKHLAYAALKGLDSKPWVMVFDDQESPEYDALGEDESFSPDGRHFAFCAAALGTARKVRGTKDSDRKIEAEWRLILDGKSSGVACDFIMNRILFSADSTYVIASGNRGGQAVRRDSLSKQEAKMPGLSDVLVTGGEDLLLVNGEAFKGRRTQGVVCRTWSFCGPNRIFQVVCGQGVLSRWEVDLASLGVQGLPVSNTVLLPSRVEAASSKQPAKARTGR